MACITAVVIVASANGCRTADLAGTPCLLTSASGAEFELRARGAAIEISQRTSDGIVALTSLGTTPASQGSLVVSSGDAGESMATVVVLGPPDMTRASVSGQADVVSSSCKAAGIAAAAIPVEMGASVTVAGYDVGGSRLFERSTTVTESGGVVAPVGSPPAT
jgi:hypothetical protein